MKFYKLVTHHFEIVNDIYCIMKFFINIISSGKKHKKIGKCEANIMNDPVKNFEK